MKHLLLIFLAAAALAACSSNSNTPLSYAQAANVMGLKLGYPYKLAVQTSSLATFTDTVMFNANSTVTEVWQKDTFTYPVAIRTGSDLVYIHVPNDTGSNSPFTFYRFAGELASDSVLVKMLNATEIVLIFPASTGGYFSSLPR